MKKGMNKLVYGILATSLVLGAGVATLKYSTVYAADTSATDTQIQAGNVAKEKSFGHHDLGRDGDKARNHKGGQGDHKGKGHAGRPGGFDPLRSPETLTKVLGVTEQELMDARKAGKSISELAKEKGIDEATLIAKLKDEMTAPLQKFVQHKGNPKLQSPNATAPAPTTNP